MKATVVRNVMMILPHAASTCRLEKPTGRERSGGDNEASRH
jgi:hypothetical protein